ncbi:circumsporozoite protein [Plasmodium falciparum FCH/4]|uniref:Circumsporozoite protein n=8 Tax=Plasmodium falciparum TaxID=5833 RepID=A0A024VVH6_PLAFA|nr:circumsporozoite protein [Plasmodium falciparum FCH/4]
MPNDPNRNVDENANANNAVKNNNNEEPSDKHIEQYLKTIKNSLSTEWSPCSVTCGNGIQVRIKPGSANKPKDQLDYENDIEKKICKMEKCSSVFNVVNSSIGLIMVLSFLFLN